MIRSTVNPNVAAIDCAAPFLFINIELPSGRMYDDSVADMVVKTVEANDVPIMRGIDGDLEQIGALIGANKLEQSVVGRMVLLPKFAEELTPSWSMEKTIFSPGFRMKEGRMPSNSRADKGLITADDIQSLPAIIAFIQS
jgi:hypothetical protein